MLAFPSIFCLGAKKEHILKVLSGVISTCLLLLLDKHTLYSGISKMQYIRDY